MMELVELLANEVHNATGGDPMKLLIILTGIILVVVCTVWLVVVFESRAGNRY